MPDTEHYTEGDIDAESDEIYTLTPWGCLCAAFSDYNVDISFITGKMGGHIVEDFMELMEKAGYVKKDGEKEI